MDVIHSPMGTGSGQLRVGALVENFVSLRIDDSPGAELVGASGIHFGSVNNLGTTSEVGVKGSQSGDVGHYEAKFHFVAHRSGTGTITLKARRLSSGGFHARDGVEIEDHYGQLRPLPAMGHQEVTVLSGAPSGNHEKTLAVNIHPQDQGELSTLIQLTISCL